MRSDPYTRLYMYTLLIGVTTSYLVCVYYWFRTLHLVDVVSRAHLLHDKCVVCE